MGGTRFQGLDANLPTILMFGDSLTEYSFFVPNGTGDELKDMFKGKINVLNFGYAGRTTRNLRDKFKSYIIAELDSAPVLFAIWLGANDATLSPIAHVPIDEFETHIRAYVDHIINHPEWDEKPKVLLMAPPPINVGHYDSRAREYGREDDGMDLGPANEEAMRKARAEAEQGIGHRTWKSKRDYAERVMAIAQSYPKDAGVAGLDVWTLFTKAACDVGGVEWAEDALPGSGLPSAKRFPEGYFTDGLHLGSLGYQLVTGAVVKQIRETWPGLLEDLA